MKFHFLEATDLNDAWFQAVSLAMTKGRRYTITKGSNEGIDRLEIAVDINILYPGSRPLHPIMPEGSNVPPPTTEEDINEYLEYLMTGEKKENEHYTYGEDLSWLHEWVINHYQKYGHGNNHGFMTVGRPETVYFYDRNIGYEETITVFNSLTGEIIRQKHISNEWNKNPGNKPSSQCLRGIDTWIDEDGFNVSVIFRSWDLWGGFPVNLGGIQLLKEYMASEIGVKDGIMHVSCPKLHIYEHTWLVALMRLRKDISILKGR
ncbi:thymidylate synthase [Patescibacteria group bacterium]|nr:thymidylate synthase [Patescibacteria group bacterium]